MVGPKTGLGLGPLPQYLIIFGSGALLWGNSWWNSWWDFGFRGSIKSWVSWGQEQGCQETSVRLLPQVASHTSRAASLAATAVSSDHPEIHWLPRTETLSKHLTLEKFVCVCVANSGLGPLSAMDYTTWQWVNSQNMSKPMGQLNEWTSFTGYLDMHEGTNVLTPYPIPIPHWEEPQLARCVASDL